MSIAEQVWAGSIGLIVAIFGFIGFVMAVYDHYELVALGAFTSSFLGAWLASISFRS